MPPAGRARDEEQIRADVVGRYSALARAAQSGQQITDCDPETFTAGCFGAAGYPADVSGLPEAARRASLGCGNPVAVAELRPGDVVLDLGSGGGIDVLLSARRVAPGGRAYGLDASPDMLALARDNAAQAGAPNVEFLQGYIEDIPLPHAHVDVVISNCVINLSADKPRALAEAFRVLRPGGKLGLSDVIAADAAARQRAEAEQAAGCSTGTLTAGEYRDMLLAAGFVQVSISPPDHAGPVIWSAIIQAERPAAPDGVFIRPMRAADAGQVLAIYQAGLDDGQASFETVAPAWQAFDRAKLRLHRHVATDASGRVLGWVAASAVSDRCAYAGVAEHSIYVQPGAHRRGIGAALLAALIGSTESAGIWTIQTGIFPENTASIRLHTEAGFRVVGTRRRIGRQHGRWRDVTFLERRSTITGTS
jgi:arsenite methyltransferase